MTKQQIFNKVVRGLAKQGFKQSHSGGHCAYRGRGGLKCAAGHLINDRHFDRSFNNVDVHNNNVAEALRKSGVGNQHLRFVSELQEAHDWNKKPADMMSALREFASENALEVPAVLREAA